MSTTEIIQMTMWFQLGYDILTIPIAIAAVVALFLTRTSQQQAKQQMDITIKEANKTLHNQHMPVVVPKDSPSATTLTPGTSSLVLINQGPGVAMNTYGVLTYHKQLQKYYFYQVYFLIAGTEKEVDLSPDTTIPLGQPIAFPAPIFEGYPFHPQDYPNGLRTIARLIITYNDIYSTRYMAVFDLCYELGWRQVGEIKEIKKRLDEQVIARSPLAQTSE